MSQESQSQTAAEPPQPEVITPSLRKRLQQMYEHGSKLAAQESYDFDYAHTLFAECVASDASNLVYIEAMFGNLQKKYNNNKRGSRLAMFSGKGVFKKAAVKKAWGEVLKLGPEILKTNPWDVPTLRSLAEACTAFGYVDAELRYLRYALDADPKDPETNRHCAISLTRIGNFDQAIACWHRVEEIKPDDPEPPQMISQLHLEKTRPRSSNLESAKGKGTPATGAKPSASPSMNAEAAQAEKPRRREIPLTARQKLEQLLSNHPADIETYLELAQLHIDEDRLVDAQRVLIKALAVSGNSFVIQDRLDDVNILRVKNQLAIAEQRAMIEPSEDVKALAVQIRNELNRVELEIYGRRSQRHPNDKKIKFELGVRLKRVGNFAEAINQLQSLRDTPELQAEIAIEVGECFQRTRQYAKALQHYQRAAELASNPNDVESKKMALYRAGVLAIGVKDMDLAERCLTTLLELDPSYKDARERLDKSREIRHKS